MVDSRILLQPAFSNSSSNVCPPTQYLQGYKAPDEGPSEYQTIPLSKIEDFGVHCKQYYPLEISHFKSTLDTQLLDQLWNKYWVNTLSQSPLLSVSIQSALVLLNVAKSSNNNPKSNMPACL